MEPNIRIMHPAWGALKGNSYRKGRCTFAYERNGRTIRLAIAFCSPKDTFTRRDGVAIAASRLVAGKDVITFELPVDNMSGAAMNQFIITVLEDADVYGITIPNKPYTRGTFIEFYSFHSL